MAEKPGGPARPRAAQKGHRDGEGGEGKGKKKKEPPDPFADTSPLGLLKREAAERLGLVEKVRAVGWAGLSAAETGRVGALVSRLARERAQQGDAPEPPQG